LFGADLPLRILGGEKARKRIRGTGEGKAPEKKRKTMKEKFLIA